MERLHSNYTFFKKFVSPIITCTILICFILFSFKSQVYFISLVSIAFLIIYICIYRVFYYKLRKIYLDETNQELILVDKGKFIKIKITDVLDITQTRISAPIIILKLINENFEEILFIPKRNYFL